METQRKLLAECWWWRVAVVLGFHCTDKAKSEGTTEDFRWSQFWYGGGLALIFIFQGTVILIHAVGE
jgi:hypothetical protein